MPKEATLDLGDSFLDLTAKSLQEIRDGAITELFGDEPENLEQLQQLGDQIIGGTLALVEEEEVLTYVTENPGCVSAAYMDLVNT
jgi:hypothetical protein